MPHPTEPRADLSWSPSGKILTVREGRHRWRLYDPGGRIARHLRRGRPYERQLLRTMAKEQGDGGTFIDVGAHVGNHTLYMATVTGCDVLAVEPLRFNWQRLAANRDLNDLNGSILIERYAAGDTFGTADWRGGRYLSLDGDVDGDVPVHPLDSMRADVDDVRVVKIDVEGFEPQALAGMTTILRRDRPIVWTESHTDDDTDRQAQVMEPIGFVFDRYMQLGSRMARWNPDGTRRKNWRMARWTT